MTDDDQQPEKNLMDPSPLVIGVMAVPVIVVLGWFAFG